LNQLSRQEGVPRLDQPTNQPTNCKARNISVTKQQQQNFKKWKNILSYGHRWMAEETVFPSMKRMFVGEHVSARKFPNMMKEIFLKASLYNMFNDMI
jgi:hypothetical protein